MTTFTVPPRGELDGIAPASDAVIDLDRARENRLLRAQVERMTARLALLEGAGLNAGRITPHSQGLCKFHLHVTVDDETPVVECADCGTKLDPMDVLREFANQERSFRYSDATARKELAEIQAQVERLKRQRQNLRQQIIRAGADPVTDARWQTEMRKAGKTKKGKTP